MPKRSQAEMRKLVWSQPSVKHSFYKNAFGEVHILSPWRLVDYWWWTREPQPRRLRDPLARRPAPSSCSWRMSEHLFLAPQIRSPTASLAAAQVGHR